MNKVGLLEHQTNEQDECMRDLKKYSPLLICYLLLVHSWLIGMMVQLDGPSHQESIRAYAQTFCQEQPHARGSNGTVDIICRGENKFDVLDKTTNQLFTFGAKSGNVVEQSWLSKSGTIVHIDPYKLNIWALAVVIAAEKSMIFVNAASDTNADENTFRVNEPIYPKLGLASVKLPRSARPNQENNIDYRLFAYVTPEGKFVVVRRSLQDGWFANYSNGRSKIFEFEEVKDGLPYINSFTLVPIKGKKDIRVMFSLSHGIDMHYKLNVTAEKSDGFTMEAIGSVFTNVQASEVPKMDFVLSWPNTSWVQDYH